jgi:hypothetical protein
MQPSERLKQVLAIGDTLALFPVLKDWPTEELQALLTDVGEYAEASSTAIDNAWKKTATKHGLFNADNARHLKFLDGMRDEKKMELMMVTSEICSVAIHYLHERGIETPDPDA